MFNTRITQMFGIQYPIIQGGLLWLSRAELAAGVSNAGGLGIITSMSLDNAQELREEIRKTKSLTDKPFGVNIPLLEAKTLRPIPTKEYIDVTLDEGVPIIETSGGNPAPFLPSIKKAGVKVIHKTTSIKFAITAEREGVDAVALLGCEGGGHPGMEDLTTMILIPRAADELKIPVIAAGGIADSRGFIAALTMGAEAIMMGTRFVVTKECFAHPAIKDWMLKAKETDTVVIERSLRTPVRVIKNKTAKEVLEMEKGGATLDELVPLISGMIGRKSWIEGNLDGGVLPCGQVVGLLSDIPSVKEVINNIIDGAVSLLNQMHHLYINGREIRGEERRRLSKEKK